MPGDYSQIQWLSIRSLLPGDSPRQAGEDIEHTRMLAKVEERLPPIIVHRPTMRVIDGAHRLGAALLRGDEMIEAILFDGTQQEAFVLAVQANIAHGLPLSLADRSRAAERIIASHPNWSDRAIAAVAGLGARTVGNIRRRMDFGVDAGDVLARTGRDGRVRPLDNAEGRLRASALIKERPAASLREIAREAHVSPSTVRDVRRRIQRGEDPVPDAGRRRNDLKAVEPGGDQLTQGPGLARMLQGLQKDPALRLTESGRTLLRWIYTRAIRPNERLTIEDQIPPHCTYIIANIARACAGEWMQLANELEQRHDNPA
jgi:ParB-like chromosome segregation protein Spo0J